MKILITGATGLVGDRLTELLLLRGFSVNFLTTRTSKLTKSKPLNGYLWNPKDGTIDQSCVEGVSAIINLAGASVAEKWTKSNKLSILESRLDTLQLLYSTLKNTSHEVEHLISASAIGVYPNSYDKLYTETEENLNSDFLGDVVQQWENAANRFEEISIKVAKIRIGIVLSKDGGALEKMAKPIKYNFGAPLGNGKQWQSWIHIDDLTDIFLYVFKHQLSGVYNGVAPKPVTNLEMTRAIAHRLKKPLILPAVPKFVLKLILGEMAQIVLMSQKVSSEKIENEGFSFGFKSIYDALSDIYD